MYSPPPGYVDIEADADAAPPPTGRHRELIVTGVGVFHARVPGPSAIAPLAMAANSKVDQHDRLTYLNKFIQHHLQPGEFEDLLARMITDEDLPGDAMLRLSRAIATTGTARPYTAVIQLALMAAHNWRIIRARYGDKGIADPMRLPSMHVVLDAAEALAVESAASGATTSAEAKQKVSDLYNRLYAPDLTELVRDVNGGKYLPPPPGFDDEAVEASFDAFLKSAR